MPEIEPRARLGPVQLRPQHGAQVPDRDLHRVRRRALRLARHVVRRPREHDRRGGVDAGGGQDRAGVADPRPVARRREEDDVADDRERRAGRDERRAPARLLRPDGREHGEGGRDDVGWDRHELGLRGGVAEGGDDAGQEEGEGVEGQAERVEGEAVQPAFGVAERGEDGRPGERLVVGGVRVGFQAGRDEGALGLGEEFGGRRVVVDEEVGGDGDEYGEDTFLWGLLVSFCGRRWGRETHEDEDPSPAPEPADTAHVRDPEGQDATEGAGKTGSGEEEGDAVGGLGALVPHGEVEDDAGEEAALGDAEEEAGGEEAGVVLADAEESGDYAPGDHQGRQPEARCCSLQH